MSGDVSFKAAIEPVGEFVVGETDAAKNNKFRLLITYSGNKQTTLDDCTFYLRVYIGSGPQALVLDHGAAKNILAIKSGDYDIENTPNGAQYFWKITSNDNITLSPDQPVRIDFENIISKTDPGTVKFDFEALVYDEVVNDDKKVESILEGELVKQSELPGIIYFYSTTEERQNNESTPESIVPAAEQLFPGEKLILKWFINEPAKIKNLQLTRNGREILSGDDFNRANGKTEIADIRQNTDFILAGKFDGKSPRAEKVQVEVLNKGWNDLSKTVDNKKLEPSLLFNANNRSIYAVFLSESPSNEKVAHIYQTGNPFWGWTPVNTILPRGFTTSPGVYGDEKLWFIGGSQIDPDVTSNAVCYFEADTNKWTELSVAPWKGRMGHACLHIPAGTINNKNDLIWVMGGCDENGNILDDVWVFDIASKNWDKQKINLPGKRCMLSSVVYNDQVWICGGAKDDPLSGIIETDIHVLNAGKWEKKENGLAFIHGDPISACLVQFQNNLHIIGKTMRNNAIESYSYKLIVPSTMEWEKQPSDALDGWGGDTLLSYQLLNFNDKLLIAKALGYEIPTNLLKVYVPE